MVQVRFGGRYMSWLVLLAMILGSDLRARAQPPVVESSAAELPRAGEPAATDASEPRVIRNLVYVQRDDGALKADLYLPKSQQKPFPAVLMVHGGAWVTGRKEQMSWHARQAAQRGLAALSINYRLAPLHPFPAQLEDVRAALVWLSEHGRDYGMDPSRVALFGYSAGGHLASLAAVAGAAEEPWSLRAVVAGGAPCEFSWIPDDSQQLAYWLGGSRDQVPQVYRQASPLHFATSDDPPFFFFHGQSDRLVPLASPRRMAERLTELGVLCQLYVVPGKGHLLSFIDPQALEKALEFLQRQLQTGDGTPPKAATP